MADGIEAPLGVFSTGLRGLRRNWGWLLALGILLIVLGIVALVDAATVSLASMLFFGWVLIVAGIIEAIQAVWHRRAHRLWLHVLNAALAIVVGAMLALNPIAGLLLITLLLAFYFTVAGIFRIAAAVAMRVPGVGLVAHERNRQRDSRNPDLGALARLEPLGRGPVYRHRPDYSRLVGGYAGARVAASRRIGGLFD